MNFSQTRIAVLGGRQINDNIYQKAYKLGGLLAKEGYLVYCGGGSRASLAGKTLKEIGFTSVQNLEGGFRGFKKFSS